MSAALRSGMMVAFYGGILKRFFDGEARRFRLCSFMSILCGYIDI